MQWNHIEHRSLPIAIGKKETHSPEVSGSIHNLAGQMLRNYVSMGLFGSNKLIVASPIQAMAFIILAKSYMDLLRSKDRNQ